MIGTAERWGCKTQQDLLVFQNTECMLNDRATIDVELCHMRKRERSTRLQAIDPTFQPVSGFTASTSWYKKQNETISQKIPTHQRADAPNKCNWSRPKSNWCAMIVIKRDASGTKTHQVRSSWRLAARRPSCTWGHRSTPAKSLPRPPCASKAAH